jgi:hypothetical protein
MRVAYKHGRHDLVTTVIGPRVAETGKGHMVQRTAGARDQLAPAEGALYVHHPACEGHTVICR